jgi:hypothetical protein
MAIFLMAALGFFLLQFRSYTWGSRGAALKALDRSSRWRPVLERYWLLSNLATAIAFVAVWAARHFHSVDYRGAAIICWIVFGLGGTAVALFSGLPDYIVMDARNRRRTKRRNARR